MPRSRFSTALLPLLALILASCGGDDPAPGSDLQDSPPAASVEESGEPTLAYARSLGVMNAREPLPGVLTAGQPTPEQARALTEAGYGTFISLRPAGESGAGWEEEAGPEQVGDFHRLAVAGPEDLSRERVEELDRILAEAGAEPVVLYCASSNRVGALLALRAHWLQGASPEEALELGREAGLTRLEPAVAELLGVEGR